MFRRNDLKYFAKRRDECNAKTAATDPGIARVHRNFADHYARVIDGDGVENGARPFWARMVG